MVPSCIDLHVDLLGHMTVYAVCTGRFGRVSVMRLHVISSLVMATRAECIAFASETEGMWIMAVIASNTRRVHATLKKRPPDVHLISNLPILEIESRIEQARKIHLTFWKASH